MTQLEINEYDTIINENIDSISKDLREISLDVKLY
jgi:hypothetical protein